MPTALTNILSKAKLRPFKQLDVINAGEAVTFKYLFEGLSLNPCQQMTALDSIHV